MMCSQFQACHMPCYLLRLRRLLRDVIPRSACQIEGSYPLWWGSLLCRKHPRGSSPWQNGAPVYKVYKYLIKDILQLSDCSRTKTIAESHDLRPTVSVGTAARTSSTGICIRLGFVASKRSRHSSRRLYMSRSTKCCNQQETSQMQQAGHAKIRSSQPWST